MQPETIKLPEGTTLTLRHTRVGTFPMDREHALAALQPVKHEVTAMQGLRLLVPQPASHLSDEEVLGLIATAVSQGLMVLHVRSPLCTADKQRFFNWVSKALSDMAADLGTTPQIIMTLAVKEGGWNKPALDHNQPLNNPFGINLTKHGSAVGNRRYATLNDATTAWKSERVLNYTTQQYVIRGEHVRGITDAKKFVTALLELHYNTVNPSYDVEFVARYDDVGRAMKACNVGQ